MRKTMTNVELGILAAPHNSWTSKAIFGLAIGCLLVLSLPGITSLFAAWSRPEYSHGYLIPLIAIFLFALLGRKNFSTTRTSSGQAGGLAMVGFGAAICVLGNLATIPDIVTYGMLISGAGLIVGTLGWRQGIGLWPAWFYLFFMLPLPNFLYWPLSIRLQFLSSDIGVWLIRLFNIPVFLDGNIIDLGVYKLQVAEACNGLRYLFPLMSFGFLFAVVYVGHWWQKIILFLSTIPITIGMNSFRIGAIGVLVNSYGIAQAEGFLHFFEGWIIFLLCIVLLYVEAALLRIFSSHLSKQAPLFDLNYTGLLAEIRSWFSPRANSSVVASSLILALAVALVLGLQGRAGEPVVRKNLDAFPMSMAGWAGKQSFLEPDIVKVLAADDYLVADYSSAAEKNTVNLLISYYGSQTKGSGMHSPEVCIPAGGWEVSRWGQFEINLEGPAPTRFDVNRAIISKGQERALVYYWFEQRGRHLTSDYMAKAYTVWDSVSRGRSDGALVRVVTVINGNDVEGADARLRHFLTLANAEIPAFVPP